MTASAQNQSVVCPQCGQENLPGTAFCDNCGAELPLPQPNASPPPEQRDHPPVPASPDEGPLPVALAQPETMASSSPGAEAPALEAVQRCENCGAQLPPNAKFCMECGTRVPPKVQPHLVRPTHCQSCGAELLPNARFCMECGTPVELIPADQAPPAAAAPEQPHQPQPQPVEERPSAPVVVSQPLEQPQIDHAPQPAPAQEPDILMPITQQQPAVQLPPFLEETTAPATEPQRAQPLPRLVLSDGQVLALPHHGEVLIGRADPVSGITPDLDLTPVGGEAGGVSRRHAVLQPDRDGWLVIDLDSTNATRLNGQRVPPHTPTPIQDGDTLRFGRIEAVFQE